ncbi:MAG TPA: hypothetical protein VG942_19020 [Hyphomonadaceae bacterium]|nr:hypothetical protein [Hyphomonadaceae bacterium]
MDLRRLSGTARPAMVAAAMACIATPQAIAQALLTPPGPSIGEIEKGISISAQVDLVFQPPGGSVKMLQNNFRTGAAEENATPNFVFEVLNQAALAGLDQALQQGAQSGRVCVVATSYHVGLGSDGIKAAAPIGVFINTTDMEVVDGKANFHTHIQFIPDGSGSSPPASGDWLQPQTPQPINPDEPLLKGLPAN